MLSSATALEVVQGISEPQSGFGRALFERRKVLGVLCQLHTDGLVDQIGNRAVDCGCLDPGLFAPAWRELAELRIRG
ncbi:MAG: hypothetical protein OXJ90_29015, partial [Spirochaetaceae bacterium]|nr:hypothetical protein [Spirochaetaceae bacterium]